MYYCVTAIMSVCNSQALLLFLLYFSIFCPGFSSKSAFFLVSSPLLRLTDIHQPFAAHYVSSPVQGCQLLMSPLGLFNLEISAKRVEGEAHSHMKRIFGAQLGPRPESITGQLENGWNHSLWGEHSVMTEH